MFGLVTVGDPNGKPPAPSDAKIPDLPAAQTRSAEAIPFAMAPVYRGAIQPYVRINANASLLSLPKSQEGTSIAPSAGASERPQSLPVFEICAKK